MCRLAVSIIALILVRSCVGSFDVPNVDQQPKYTSTTLPVKSLSAPPASRSNYAEGISIGGPTINTSPTSSEAAINKASNRLEQQQQAAVKSQLARKIGANAMMSGFIFSFTVVPLLLAITSLFSPTLPLSSGFYGRYKRALVNETHLYRHLPLMNRDETRRFLSLFETTLLNRKIFNENCKKHYSCKVFRNAVRRGTFPTLADFEYALLNVFGIVAERYDHKLDLVPTVKMYYEIATNALKGISCSQVYPCSHHEQSSTSQRSNLSTNFNSQRPSAQGWPSLSNATRITKVTKNRF